MWFDSCLPKPPGGVRERNRGGAGPRSSAQAAAAGTARAPASSCRPSFSSEKAASMSCYRIEPSGEPKSAGRGRSGAAPEPAYRRRTQAKQTPRSNRAHRTVPTDSWGYEAMPTANRCCAGGGAAASVPCGVPHPHPTGSCQPKPCPASRVARRLGARRSRPNSPLTRGPPAPRASGKHPPPSAPAGWAGTPYYGSTHCEGALCTGPARLCSSIDPQPQWNTALPSVSGSGGSVAAGEQQAWALPSASRTQLCAACCTQACPLASGGREHERNTKYGGLRGRAHGSHAHRAAAK